MSLTIRTLLPGDESEWLRMRSLLWPDCPLPKHKEEMQEILSANTANAVFVAWRSSGGLGGFLEISIRSYADGCDTRPVGYIEGWFVDEDLRRQKVGAQLVQAAEEWARTKGLQEIASDCLLENEISFRAHLSLGYEETERLIHFRKWLVSPPRF